MKYFIGIIFAQNGFVDRTRNKHITRKIQNQSDNIMFSFCFRAHTHKTCIGNKLTRRKKKEQQY